jgi:dinuclear metal center YbgI/SA1388 family protein
MSLEESRKHLFYYLCTEFSVRIMKIKEIVSALERFAPLPLQDGFDNAGLQIGLTDAEATGALLCLDVTESVIDEAIALRCNMVISHHPLIFKGYKSITGKDYVERCILKAIKNDIVIYSAHTNLDNAQGGVNYKIAEKLGLDHVEILDPKSGMLLKLVTFVPESHAEKVRNALFDSGCGNIGNYDSCSYNVSGEGTFRAQENAYPFCGEIGKLHREKEVRIETVLPAYKRNDAVKALLLAHPYEEPVFDLYYLQNTWMQAGSGIIGELNVPEPELDFLKRLKKTFNLSCVKHNTLTGRMIKKIALCGGSGSFLIPLALRNEADVFITGEIKYHDYFGYDNKILLAEIGHYESEQYTKEIFYTIIRDLYPNFTLFMSKVNTNPIKYI